MTDNQPLSHKLRQDLKVPNRFVQADKQYPES